jgi:hypothetical protein
VTGPHIQRRQSRWSRRNFLRAAASAGPAMILMGRTQRGLAGEWEQGDVDIWKEGSFVQRSVDTSKVNKGVIRAHVNGGWHDYTIRSLPEPFVSWNLKARLDALDSIAEGGMPGLAGPHSASVATYGGGRRDSRFSLNNAVKGMGFVPSQEKMVELTKRLKGTFDKEMKEKTAILRSLYQSSDLFDLTKQVSMELYSEPGFETHTFLNLMANPVATIVFLDIPSYEIRAICRLVHPQDTTASDDEKAIVEYVNLVHDYFHGKSPRPSIGMIFHVIEVFDNTPGRPRGERIVPPLV